MSIGNRTLSVYLSTAPIRAERRTPMAYTKKSTRQRAADPVSMNSLRIAVNMLDYDFIDLSDPVAVSKRIQEYFNLCLDNSVRPCASGVAGALGITTQALRQYALGILPQKAPKELAVVCQRAMNVIEQVADGGMLNGDVAPVAGIFQLTNNAPQSWKQYQSPTAAVTVQNFNPAEISTDALRKRYLSNTPPAPPTDTEKPDTD